MIEGNDKDDSCVLIRQGAHHVIVRGLVLKDCKRYGVLIQRQGGDTPSDAQTHDIVIEDIASDMARSGGPTYNFVARNNLWPASRVTPQDGPFDLGREGQVERIPNFNDRDPRPQAGAQRAGAPSMRSGAEAYIAAPSAD